MALRVGSRPSEAALGKVPPHNLEAEESVLGACLISREAIANVLEILGHDDFYKPAHNEIFHTILDLYGRGDPIDAVTLAEELRRRDKLEAVGGKHYLFHLVQSVPTPGSAAHYAKIVEENALLRRLIEASHTISDIAYNIPEDVEAAIDMSEDLIYQVSQRRDSSDFQALKDLLTENMEMVEKLYERGSSITGLPTGFTELDNITAGLQPSNLIIVAARPAMGKSSLAVTMAQHVAVEQHAPVVIFSLEMSKMELVQRLMCAEARVDSNRLRRGMLQDSDWPKLSHALGRLAEAPIFIDDTASVTIMEMRAKCRRLKAKHGLSLVIVDYLQLMQPHPGRRSDNRVQEVSEISRALKILARELEVPVIAVSQLSRNVEHRTDKRPMLADLRESGCLTGDTLITRADTGEQVTMAELLEKGERNIPVWTLDDDLKLKRGIMTHVFPSGVKEVFQLTLRSGRVIRASANHPFLSFDGWKRLDELSVGERLATPRQLPEPSNLVEWPDSHVILLAHLIGDGCFVKNQPLHYTNADPANLEAVREAAEAFGVTGRLVKQKNWWHLYLPAPFRLTHGKRNPICQWLDELGLYGRRSREKFIPKEVFRLPNRQIRLFLHHLWATDGSIVLLRDGRTPIYYASGSMELARGVQSLLLRLGISTKIGSLKKKGYPSTASVVIQGVDNQSLFVDLVGCHGKRGEVLPRIRQILSGIHRNPNLDTVPAGVWGYAKRRLVQMGVSQREFASRMAIPVGSSSMFRVAPSRARLHRAAELLEDDALHLLSDSDLFWDEIKSKESIGYRQVFDATVPSTHNFVAEGVITHNSIEQDSDIVMFIYRDEVYNPDSTQKGIAEIIIAKHRNGPIGKVDLAFLDHYTKFANLARGV